jgi:hypothetical protein
MFDANWQKVAVCAGKTKKTTGYTPVAFKGAWPLQPSLPRA